MTAAGRAVRVWTACALVLVADAAAVVLRGAAPEEGPASGEVALSLAGVLATPVVGAVIAVRLPGNPYGRLLIAVGAAFGGTAVGNALRGYPQASQLAGFVEGGCFLLFLVLTVFVFLLFPTGRLPGPAWRWLGRASVALAVLTVAAGQFSSSPGNPAYSGPFPLHGLPGRVATVVSDIGFVSLFVCWLAATASVVVRYRRAAGQERLQLRWFLLAAAVNGVVTAAGLLGQDDGLAWTVAGTVGYALIPVAIGVAVLRYRLYQIDRIISRTVSYAVLTAGLLAAYLLAVTLLRGLVQPVTGSSDLAVAASTLGVAAVFQPARRRVQRVVDRRFDRSRYDAARTVDAYARRLRTEVDLDEVATGLRDTVSATVAPQRVGLWLRDPAGLA